MPTLIVADASPLISFARANKLHLVQMVCKEIIIPPAVYGETVVKGKGKLGATEIEKASWISLRKPKNQIEVKKLAKHFGQGESEAIALAEELKAILLADERVIIKEARKRNLHVISTHLILIQASKMNLIKSVKKELGVLIASGFRTTPELIKETLKKAKE